MILQLFTYLLKIDLSPSFISSLLRMANASTSFGPSSEQCCSTVCFSFSCNLNRRFSATDFVLLRETRASVSKRSALWLYRCFVTILFSWWSVLGAQWRCLREPQWEHLKNQLYWVNISSSPWISSRIWCVWVEFEKSGHLILRHDKVIIWQWSATCGKTCQNELGNASIVSFTSPAVFTGYGSLRLPLASENDVWFAWFSKKPKNASISKLYQKMIRFFDGRFKYCQKDGKNGP